MEPPRLLTPSSNNVHDKKKIVLLFRKQAHPSQRKQLFTILAFSIKISFFSPQAWGKGKIGKTRKDTKKKKMGKTTLIPMNASGAGRGGHKTRVNSKMPTFLFFGNNEKAMNAGIAFLFFPHYFRK